MIEYVVAWGAGLSAEQVIRALRNVGAMDIKEDGKPRRLRARMKVSDAAQLSRSSIELRPA